MLLRSRLFSSLLAPFRFCSSVSDGFEQLGVQRWLVERLKKRGISVPTEVQRKALPRLLSGCHAVVNAETGSGKTLCFLLPVLQSIHQSSSDGHSLPSPYALVLAPSPELAVQISGVYDGLVGAPGSSSVLHSSRRLVLKPSTQMIVATPNSLLQYDTKRILKAVRMICCDEADILLTGGESEAAWRLLNTVRELHQDSIRRKYSSKQPPHPMGGKVDSLSVSSRSSVAGSCQLVFTAATLPRGGRRTVHSILQSWVPKSTVFVSTGHVHQILPSAHLTFIDIGSSRVSKEKKKGEEEEEEEEEEEVEEDSSQLFERKFSQLLQDLDNISQLPRPSSSSCSSSEYLSDSALGPLALVFCNTVETAAHVHHHLSCHSYGHWWTGRVAQLHKHINIEERVEVLEQLWRGDVKVVVCTDMASRGLDFSVTDVIQFDFPGNSADFLHRAGRTARAGRSGRVLSYVTAVDQDLAAEIKRVLEEEGRTFAEIFSRNKMLRRKMEARKRART